MRVFKADEVLEAQAVEPQIARWTVGDKLYVIENDADWADARLPDIVKQSVAEESQDVEVHRSP